MRKTLTFLLTLTLVTGSLYAQSEWPVNKHVYSNGLTLLTLEDHSIPAIGFQIWYHNGSKNERPGITGISHLFEHLMSMGTEKLGPEEYAKIIQKNGGTSNAYTSYDMTFYVADIGKDKLSLIAELESDRIQHLKLTEENLASERQVVMEERGFRIDNSPFGDVTEQLFANLWQAYSYGWHIIGWRKDLESITLQQCKDYFRTYYNPANAVMVIVGDIDTKETIKTIDKYFGKIPGNKDIPRPIYNEPPQRGERRINYHKNAQLPFFFAGYHTPAAGHPDSYPLEVLSRILSGGQSSRTYKRLVYDEQLAIFAGGENGPREQAGVFYAYAAMQPGHTTAEGEKALYEEIEKMQRELVSDEELQKAKNQIEAEFYMGSQSNDQKARQLGEFQTLRGDYKLLFQEAEKLNAVTKEDIMRVAKEYLHERNRTVVTVIQEKSPVTATGL